MFTTSHSLSSCFTLSKDVHFAWTLNEVTRSEVTLFNNTKSKMPYTQKNLYFTVTTPLGKDKLLFKSLQGEESISDLFHFNVEMLSEAKDLDFEKIIGKNMTVNMKFAKDHQRYFNAVVTRFVQAGSDSRFTTYHAELRPWFWILTLTKDCKIFQNMKVPDIIKKVFDDLGFKGDDYYRDALKKTYEIREYCVQYEETAFNFVSRLMEDEGIFYFFEHTESQHVLVLADDLDTHKNCPTISTARFWQVTTEAPPEDVITECRLSQQVTVGKYAVDDFNFETPTTDLLTSVTGESGKMRIYEYPAGYSKTQQGEKIAQRRIESYEWKDKLLDGQGHCFGFVAGYKFKLTEHSAQNFNANYVLRWVSHSLSLTHYANSFQAFPAEVPFRPPIVTPKPRIHSTQSALVVGKKGEEIFTDKYGRIKVQFHWDQEGKNDEKSSCWIRVNQSWAGKTWGNFWLPRIGQEVIVSFLNGDPDRPLVTGAVYNAQQTVPYPLPAEQTKSTIKSHSTKEAQGFNEMRFEDKKDSEEFFMHAQKDMNTIVLNNQTNTIKKNRTTTIEEEDDQLTVAKGNRTVTVKQNEELTVEDGDRTITIAKGKEEHTIKKDYTITVGGDLLIDVEGSITIKSGKSVTIKAAQSLTTEAGTSLTNKAGTSLADEAGTSLTNEAGTSMSNKANISITSKANASHTVEASGMVTVKGAIVMIN